MQPKQVYDEFVAGFSKRKFSAGLLVTFIDFLRYLDVGNSNFEDLNDFSKCFPIRSENKNGSKTNQLLVDIGDGETLGIRSFYNDVQAFIRAEKKRFDYPSCAPHATQAWRDYKGWLDALVTFSDDELRSLRRWVIEFILRELPSHELDPSTVRTEPPLFRLLLEEFDMDAHKNELTGAAFQGTVFGFLRADNPHLQIEIDKVRTGSKRLQRVGDIDGWEGARLILSAEVKSKVLQTKEVADLEGFANAVGQRGAVGLIAALDFEYGVREEIEGKGVIALSRRDLITTVRLWDPLKQRTAVSGLLYYVMHVEKNSSLGRRLQTYFTETAEKVEEASNERSE